MIPLLCHYTNQQALESILQFGIFRLSYFQNYHLSGSDPYENRLWIDLFKETDLYKKIEGIKHLHSVWQEGIFSLSLTTKENSFEHLSKYDDCYIKLDFSCQELKKSKLGLFSFEDKSQKYEIVEMEYPSNIKSSVERFCKTVEAVMKEED